MGLLSRGDIPRPVRKAEAVMVEALGGEVKVRQMTLPTYLALVRGQHEHGDSMPLGLVMAECVVDADDLPIFSEEEWNIWGASHPTQIAELWTKVRMITSIEPEVAEKK